MKYDAWHIAMPDQEALDALAGAGYSPLVGYALCARGCRSAEAARAFVDVSQPHDPFLLPDMAAAVDRIRRALEAGEPMAVYGDYDVDGMTSVALLTRFLRSLGGQVTTYVPDRMEEGYGLNAAALGRLYDEGVRLVITVDAGITAIAEAETARAMGLELIITDHHQCRETLPDACAVVNPCRADSVYPFAHLAGVGVAFKLACALAAPVSQDKLLDRYGDLLALGTVADVMPLSGENRLFVRRGLAILARDGQVGLQALLTEAGASDRRITAATLGFTLAPRVNAAGRMGNAALAVELLMTDDPIRAPHLAAELCDLNRTRQQVENEIFTQALDLIDEEAESAPALVLAGEGWHPGVVGIVASRLLERFGKSVYLICLAEGVGKGSARGGAGANLAGTLAGAADLLQTYGGHEQAAGFSLTEENIPAFRARLAELLSAQGGVQEGPSLSVDGLLSPALFNYGNIDDLRALEPYGTGNPVPVFALENAALERVTPVGGGRHVKLTLRIGDMEFPGIFFGVTPLSLGFTEGDTVDVAFRAEINDFQNRKQAQLQLCDMRLAAPAREREAASLALYRRFRASEPLGKAERAALCPDRTCLGAVWRYLKRGAGPVTDQTAALARKISRAAGFPVLTGVLLAALDVFAELGLVLRYQVGDEVTLTPKAGPEKVDLSASEVLGRLTVGE